MNENFLIVVLNGPPHCGKDTIAQRLFTSSHPFTILNHMKIMFWNEKMIAPVKDAVCAFFQMSNWDLEVMKDEPVLPNGVTIREAIIALDTNWVRPLFGAETLGEMMVKALKSQRRRTTTAIPSSKDVMEVHIVDTGFEDEFQVLKKAFGDRIKVIHISRDGCSFTDNRVYISQCDGRIENNGTVTEAVQSVLLFVNKWLKELENDKLDGGTTSGVPQESESDQSPR